MAASLEELKSKSSLILKKRKNVVKILKEYEESLVEAIQGIPVYGRSVKETLSDIGPDDWIYGYLLFTDGQLRISYRSTEQDMFDELDQVPTEYRTNDIKSLADAPVEWLEKLSQDRVFQSLTNSIAKHLDYIDDASTKSLQTLDKALHKQTNITSKDYEVELTKLADDHLLQSWIEARRNIHVNSAVSITGSSSYLESVCKKILNDLSIPLQKKQTISNLFSEVVKAIGVSENAQIQNDIVQIIGGIKSIFNGVGALRTHFGSAHGSSINDYKPNEYYARLVNDLAASVSIFILYRHKLKYNKSNQQTA